MKTLHVIDSLNTGGAEKVCLDIITMLIDAGYQADCMVISSKGALYDQIDSRARVFFLNRRHKFSLIKMRKCALLASQYDIVHVHMRHTWAYVKLSSLLFNRKLKLLFHDHFWEINTFSDATFRLRGILKPQFYVGVSNNHIVWARRVLQITEKNIYVLKNTVIPDYGSSNIYHGDLLMISNLREIKNVLFGINLANHLKRKLTIFGSHDGAVYGDMVLREAASSEYITIIQNEWEVQKYLNNFSLAIHTAFLETGPLVLLEYMAHGLPFITFRTGAVVEQIKDVFPFLIAESFDLSEWEKKINLLESRIRNEGDTLASDLKKVFADKFSPDNYLEQCLMIYQNVLNS